MSNFTEITELFFKCDEALKRICEFPRPEGYDDEAVKKDEDLIMYFDMRLAEALISDRFVNSKRLAKIILDFEEN